jgi:hypothetical protein
MGKESHSVEAAVKQLKVSAKKRLNRERKGGSKAKVLDVARHMAP